MIIVCNLHNLKTNRYHPILFRESPLPSGGPMRHKSSGHHTIGFDTREDAIKHCEKMANKPDFIGQLCLDKDFPWDGEDIPAMVVFFGEIGGKLEPMF